MILPSMLLLSHRIVIKAVPDLVTFRFSGGADAQLRPERARVAGCSRLPLAVDGCRRCRHGCRQRYQRTSRF
jgi:hypothetical protein